MRFHVLGIGPVGSLISYYLRSALPSPNSITIIHRTRRQAREHGSRIRVERDGVVTSTDGFKREGFDTRAKKIWDRTRGEEIVRKGERDSDPIESLFVATRAHHVRPAIQRLLPRLSRTSTITLLHNGMGVYEQLVREVFRNPEHRPHFILAANSHGSWFKSLRTAVHARVGEILFSVVADPGGRQFEAALSDESVPRPQRSLRLDDISDPPNDPSFSRYRSLRNTVAVLCSLGDTLHTSWMPMAQIQITLRRRLVVHSVINPVTAILGCRNGDVFTTTAARRLMYRICQEAADVFAEQIKSDAKAWLGTLAGPNTNIPVGRIPYALTKDSLIEECLRVAEYTKGNISPMLMDIRRGRLTEVDFHNGYLLNLGTTYKVPMPATATLLNMVKMRSTIPLEQIF